MIAGDSGADPADLGNGGGHAPLAVSPVRLRPRVVVLAGARFPIAEPFAGGMESQTWSLVNEHRRARMPVCLRALPGSDPALGLGPSLEVVPSDPTYDPARSRSPASERRSYLRVMGELHDAVGEFDLVHNNGVHHLPVALAPRLPVPMLTTLHTPPTPEIESTVRRLGRSAVGYFVAVSKFIATAWEPLLGPLPVIGNGIDLTRFTPGRGGDDVVWTGRIVPEKAPHLAIDAARLAGHRIALAGPVHDWSYWESEVAPRLGRGARWVGHLSADDLRDLVGGSSVAVVTPAWDEPFGLVALEALACATPVAAFDRGAISETVDETCGRLARPGSVVSLAAAIAASAELDRDRARERAEAVGSASRMARRYRRLYRTLTG